MAGVKIPYPLIPAVKLEDRYAHMQSAIDRRLPRLARAYIDTSKVLSVACYGPSLADTWRELQPPIISMSGATKWLAERGVIADYHIDMDPRKNKVMTSLPAVSGVTYLVASVCAPEYFDALLAEEARVILWHTVSSNWDQDLAWVARHDEGALVVSTGSTIGLGAIQLGGVLGYNRFEIHGMDGSFADGKRHAGVHAGKVQPDDITWDAGRVTYRTSKIMANAVAETINTVKNFPITTVFHGHGLTQALIREANYDNSCCADETEKRQRLSALRPHVAHIPPMPKGKVSFWDALLKYLQPTDLPDLIANIGPCERRRTTARYNTGSVPLDTAVQLRALCRFYEPTVIAEVGTFIGTSAMAMVAKRVTYTCDRSNDCVPASESLITHPYRSSTEMLAELQEKVDLFFFDGRIQPEDIGHIVRLSHPMTVYAFDDYTKREKGVANVELLGPHLNSPMLIEPAAHGSSTLAVLVPRMA